MSDSALATASKRAGRALARAGSDRRAQLAAGAATATGAALVAGKAVAERVRSADDDSPSRTYRLKRKEDPASGVERMAIGRIDSALEHLRNGSGDVAEAVHEARKDMKKLRSLLRLVRPHLGEERYERENTRLREVGRSLGGARDAEVKLATLEGLRERYEDEFPAEDARAALEEALRKERDALAGQIADDDGGHRAKALHELEAARAGFQGWEAGADGWSLFSAGLGRGYRRGRNRFADVRKDPSSENVHEWRKRAKDLWYHQRTLRNAWRPVLSEAADETHELADLLGDHHDLAVLGDDVRGRGQLLATPDRETLEALIARRQDELLEPAIALGERIYAEKPKRFTRRIRAYWRAWR